MKKSAPMREQSGRSSKDIRLTPQLNPNPVLQLNRSGEVLFANDAAQEFMTTLALSEGALASWQLFQEGVWKETGSDQPLEISTDKQTFLFRATLNPDGSRINLYGMDATELKTLSRRMQDLANNLPGALFDYTSNADGSDQIQVLNSGCEDIWELSRQEIEREPAALWAMVHPDDLGGMQQSVSASAENLKNWHYDWRITTPGGQKKWLQGAGSPIRGNDGSTCWTTIITDITKVKSAERAVSAALQKTVFVLSAAMEARDPYTAGHEERVARIVRGIGAELGLDDYQLTGLKLAATVHDIGKINIPAEILNKPGKLSDLEYELIKKHSRAGAELLAGVGFEWPISDIILQHHERYDGSGYPQGLRGKNILLEARIIAVADVLEAMTGHRPYRPALGLQPAIEEIRQGSGTRYDPNVADACLKLIKENRLDAVTASDDAPPLSI